MVSLSSYICLECMNQWKTQFPHVHDTSPQFPLNCHFQLKLSSNTLSSPPIPLTFQEGIFYL